MADLYGTNSRSSALESEDMSSFLRNLLHNSFTPPTSSSCPLFKDKNKQLLSSHTLPPPPPPPPPPTEATSNSTTNLVCSLPIFFDSDCRFKDRASIAGSSVMVDSSAGFNFSDPGKCFMADPRECTRNTFSAACAVDLDGITSSLKRKFPADSDVDDFRSDCQNGPEASEAPVNTAQPSRSSKRSRAAEFHNLSEKRRRSRINEKLKALQNLIPNSNKTDKASMLDEAIEYLKQLQLQVQMLSMRNGLSLHPFCLTGSLHPTHLPLAGIGFDECNEVLNTNRREDAFSRNQEISVQASFDLPNQCTPTNQPNLTSQVAYIMNPETSFGLEPSIQNCYGPFNHLAPSKEHCQERPSQLPLDMSFAGKNTSAGVSS